MEGHRTDFWTTLCVDEFGFDLPTQRNHGRVPRVNQPGTLRHFYALQMCFSVLPSANHKGGFRLTLKSRRLIISVLTHL
jgi:hypothetical protein